MKLGFSVRRCLGILVPAALALLPARGARGYIEAPYALGRLVAESTNILLMRVEQVDRDKNLIIYRKVQDIKGTHPSDTIKHNVGRAGFSPREWQNIMAWAEVGQAALFFHNGGIGECCIHNYWYQVSGGDWWGMTHAEPYLLRSYAGKPEKLAVAVAAMLTGQEVLVPCMVDGDKNTLQLRSAKLQRLKASLRILDYNPARDFAGWGVEEFAPVLGMPGFTHHSALTRVSPGAAGASVADFDGDGKADLCLFGGARMALLQNGGGSFNEIALPVEGGAYAADWADFNGDGRPDLLLATPTGPRLFLNEPKAFRDLTAALPCPGYCHSTAAAWIDHDGDGRADVLLADGFLGLRLYRNLGLPVPPEPDKSAKPPTKTPAMTPLFEDVSDKVGLGAAGIAARLKGDRLLVADIDGDGRADFLFSAGRGVLAINAPGGFVESKDSGIAFQAGGVAPAFGDFDGDKWPDLFVPQDGKCKLYRNDGRGRFADVTALAGALAESIPRAVCAVWTDLRGRGRKDLFVGCLKGPNRYFRNNGDGAFADETETLGLDHRIFNTRGLAVLDINRDGAPDVVFVNEGQASAAMLGSPSAAPPGLRAASAR